MIELDHLQSYQLTLTVRGLLHIGNGQKLPKKEYLFNNRTKVVSFVDERAFFDLLIRFHLVDQFERFCMYGQGDLYSFLFHDCRLTPQQVQSAIRYQINAGDALDENHSLRDISRFVRNGRGDVYVPGSSVKGAIRTALLFQRIMADGAPHDSLAQYFPEAEYLHTLNLTRNSGDAINSLMRGIHISDSAAIPDSCMTLASKNDGFVDGQTNAINLCRECAAPGTPISLRLTLDQSVLKGTVTIKSILDALNAFERYYQEVYLRHFVPPRNSEPLPEGAILRMGGGAGFFGKSLAYPYLGERNGLIWVSDRLARSFSKHHHERDRQLGISPRTMKYGRYQNKFHSFGVCEVSIQ